MKNHPRLYPKMLQWNKLQANTRGIGISYKHAGHFQETHEVRCGCSKLQERHRVSLPPALRQQILQAEGSSQNEIHLFWSFLARIPDSMILYQDCSNQHDLWLVGNSKLGSTKNRLRPKESLKSWTWTETSAMPGKWDPRDAPTDGKRCGRPCAWSSAVQRLSFTCLSSSNSCSCFTWAKMKMLWKY